MSRNFLKFWLIFLPQIAILYGCLFLAIRLRYPEGLQAEALYGHLWTFTWIFALWLLNFFIHGFFDQDFFRRFTVVIFRVASATAVNLLVAIVFFYFQPDLILTPRRFLLIVVALSFAGIALWNLLVKYLLKNRLAEDIYLFSFGSELSELEEEIFKHAYLGYKVKGHLNESNLGNTQVGKDSIVVLPDNLQAKPEILSRFFSLRMLGVSFYNHRDFYEMLLRRVYLSEVNEFWFLENISYRQKRLYGALKRIIDFCFGLISGAVFMVFLPFVFLLIKSTSPGPIFFVQKRVGKRGKVFNVYKFRTMRHGGPSDTWTEKGDLRITAFGKFLRKTRIDELPQALNLLLGNMSLVGPRPEQPNIVENLKKEIPFYEERHLVKPGLSGWAQINNIYAASSEETRLKLQYDLYYIKHRGFLMDMEIILKTFYYLLTWQGR